MSFLKYKLLLHVKDIINFEDTLVMKYFIYPKVIILIIMDSPHTRLPHPFK